MRGNWDKQTEEQLIKEADEGLRGQGATVEMVRRLGKEMKCTSRLTIVLVVLTVVILALTIIMAWPEIKRLL